MVACRPPEWVEGDPPPDIESLIIASLNRIRRLLADPATSSQNTLLQSIALNRQPHGGTGQIQIPIVGPAGQVIDDCLVVRRGQPAYGSKAAKSAGAGKRALAGLPPDIRIRAVDEISKAGIKLNEEVDERLQMLLASSSQQSRGSDQEEEREEMEAETSAYWSNPDQRNAVQPVDQQVGQPFRRREGDDAVMRSPSRLSNSNTFKAQSFPVSRISVKRSVDDTLDVSSAQSYAAHGYISTSALATRLAGSNSRKSLWEAASGL